MATPAILRASANSADPVSSATRWMWFGMAIILLFGAIGSQESGALFAVIPGAVLVGLYTPLLKQIGVLKKPFLVCSLADVEDRAAHAHALTRIESYNGIFRAFLSVSLRLFGIFLMTLWALAPTRAALAGSITLLFGAVTFMSGTRLAAKSAIRLLRQDAESRHVLYLRPFDIDDVVESATGKVRWWRPKDFLQAREEPVLSDMFALLGPVVAVGRPGEPIPQLGAARMYMKDDDWKDQVRTLIEDASVALLRVGQTAGFLWEVEQVLKAKKPEEILFYFSPSLDSSELKVKYEVFRKNTEHLFQKPLPEEIGANRFLSFESDWSVNSFGETPVLFPKHNFILPRALTTLTYHHKLQRSLGDAIRPFFERLGYGVSEKPVFSNFTTAVGTVFGGPLTGGIMMVTSSLFVGEVKRAVYIFISTFAIALLVIAGANLSGYNEMLAGATISQSFLMPDPIFAVDFLLAFAFYNLWKRYCGDKLRVHLRTGGHRISNWISIIIVIGAFFVWNSVATIPISLGL